MNGDRELAIVQHGRRTTPHGLSGSEFQVLIFRLGQVQLGVEAAAVAEMHFLPDLAPLEEAPPALAGLLNLRGDLIPVLDLEFIFGRTRRPRQLSQGIVILQKADFNFAIIVDEVQSVVNASPEDVRELPHFGDQNSHQNSCVKALLHWEEKVVMLLDLERVWQATQLSGDAHNQWDASLGHWEASSFLTEETGNVAEVEAEFLSRARHLMRVSEVSESETGLFAMALVEIGGETFGVSLKEMREFTDLRLVSPVPCCPDFILGQMNLRGDVVTLVDVRPVLGLLPRPISQGGQVMVVHFQESPVGILLDAVLDVVYLPGESLLTTGASVAHAGRFFSGGVLHSGKMICLLDLERLLTEGLEPVDETP